MKLSPPASSSDLDTAREIAKRLHLRRRADEPVRSGPGTPSAQVSLLGPASAARTAAAPSSRPAVVQPPAAPLRAAAPATVPEPQPAARPAAPPVPQAPVPPAPVFQPPIFQPPAFEPPPVPAPRPAPPPVPPSRTGARPEPVAPRPGIVAPPKAPAPSSWREGGDVDDSLTPPGLPALDSLSGLTDAREDGDAAIEAETDDGSIVIEETDSSLEDIVGSGELPVVEDLGPAEAGGSAEDPLQEVEYEAPAESPLEEVAPPSLPFEDTPTPPDIVSEELFDMPPPPSWGDIAETCMSLGHARGAMLIDPNGQVFATRGQWPDPGANAIATKLVAMMDKTLKDAPTRSVSAPLGGLHLTAWRVPLAEGLVTAAFIADSPLRAELRAPIDAQILGGEGL